MSEVPADAGAISSSGVSALQDEIEQTRAELGSTVEALAARADVSARARQSFETLLARTGRGVGAAGTTLAVAVAGVRRSVAAHPGAWAIALAGLAGAFTVLPRRAEARRPVRPRLVGRRRHRRRGIWRGRCGR